MFEEHMESQSRQITSSDSIRVWDLPLRHFHWLLVIAIAVAFLSSEEGSPLSEWHIASGWVVAVLIVFRLIWGFIGGEHSRFANFVKPSAIGHHVKDLFRARSKPSLGHNALGAVSALLLLALIAATVWTGIMMAEGGGEDIHELIAYVLLALVAVHILAVIVMSFLTRDNLVRAMITGSKRAERHREAREARRPALFAYLLAALVIAGTIYAIVAYDPAAFELRSADSFEHQGRDYGAGEHETDAEDD
jgi:cytochrome b